MPTQGSASQYRFNLKEGDLIQATITKLGGGDHQVDTSQWANVETATMDGFTDPGAVQLGSNLHVRVRDIEENCATLEQAEHVYQRHHRPGDTLRVQIIEKSTAKLYQAEPDRWKNLENLYVVGVELGADVTVEIVKVRSGTAIAIPNEVHQEGVTSGLEFGGKTSAGSQHLSVSDITDQDIGTALSAIGANVKLTAPAQATSTAIVEIVDVSNDEVKCEIQRYSANGGAELPSTGEAVRTDLNKEETKTTVSLSDNASIAVRLADRAPCTGTASVTLTGVTGGTYTGSIKQYIEPHLKVGNRYSAKINGYTNEAKIKSGEYQISVKLKNEISRTGKGTVEITAISNSVRGKVIGDIKQMAENNNSSDVDLTNLSKL